MSTRIIYQGVMRKPHSYGNRYTPHETHAWMTKLSKNAPHSLLARARRYIIQFVLTRSRRALIVTSAATAKIPGPVRYSTL